MKRPRSMQTSRGSLSTSTINEARALLDVETATVNQLNAMYGCLKANNDALRKIIEGLEGRTADEEFGQECTIGLKYEASAASVMSQLLSKRDCLGEPPQPYQSLGQHRQPVVREPLEPSYPSL
ncbi:hypothetical protein HPB50_000074 [Hyalomma asiaticum]|uniref:Uncharacterized protein n=1 Tax=Hyalomma asiaticum TaxID=266040 RepID=A0ACB7T2C9_HYAAI|nr:hypothetical protein HPB50_000074 [Hyalomma asiaticum]